MFGVEPLARIVHNDARIEVKVPAAKGKKAYSYFREGGEGEAKRPSNGDKKLALIGGGLALAGLGAAAIAMGRKKTETVSVATPIASPINEVKSVNNTVRNTAIATGVAGLGASVAMIIARRKEKEGISEYISETAPAIWTQAIDNRSEDSISVGGQEITDVGDRQGLVSAIYQMKGKKLKDLEEDGIGIIESREYFKLELMREAFDVEGRFAPIVLVGKKPPSRANEQERKRSRRVVLNLVSDLDTPVTGKSYSALLEYMRKAY